MLVAGIQNYKIIVFWAYLDMTFSRENIMKLTNKILSIITLSVFSHTASAVPFALEGRSLGMGGVSVATADLATAAWANPAMLTKQRPGDKFSLLIGGGALLRDDDDLITDIDNFQAADNRRNTAINAGDTAGETQAISEMNVILRQLEGKVIAPELTGLTAVGMAFDEFAMAVSVRSDVVAGGAVTDLSSDPNDVFSDQFNILNIEGVLATEIGVSFAKDFVIANKKVSIGIKPKLVDL